MSTRSALSVVWIGCLSGQRSTAQVVGDVNPIPQDELPNCPKCGHDNNRQLIELLPNRGTHFIGLCEHGKIVSHTETAEEALAFDNADETQVCGGCEGLKWCAAHIEPKE